MATNGPLARSLRSCSERALSAIAEVFRAGLAARPAAPLKSPKSPKSPKSSKSAESALRRGSTPTPARRKRR